MSAKHKRFCADGVKSRPLGEYIEGAKRPCGEECARVSGVDINKQFITTRANLEETDTSKYLCVLPRDFACNLMHVGRDERLPVAFNDSCNDLVVTSAYYVFRMRDDKSDEMLDKFLYLLLSRKEFDRLTWFYTDSSIRGNLKEKRFAEIKIPVPSLDVQREVVEAWQGLRKIKEENEGLVEPLLALCRSYLQECKKKYPMKEIGPYLTPHDERNSELRIKLAQGVANTKVFQDPKQVSSNSRADKIVHPGQFAYNRATTRNGEKISIAYREGPDCTVSSAYQVFSISDESYLNPHYLLLWVSRPEFDRYARYMSKGSAHEFFEFEEMCRVKIPLPPIKVQRAIVDVYRCANESKWIAAEADRLSREICPALVRWAEEGGCK